MQTTKLIFTERNVSNNEDAVIEVLTITPITDDLIDNISKELNKLKQQTPDDERYTDVMVEAILKMFQLEIVPPIEHETKHIEF